MEDCLLSFEQSVCAIESVVRIGKGRHKELNRYGDVVLTSSLPVQSKTSS